MLRKDIDPRTGYKIGHENATIPKAPGLAERNRIEAEWRS